MFFSFSSDGRTVVYTDLGPDTAGEDTVQVVTLDVSTGQRTQLTRLPAGAITNPPDIFPTCCARFLNAGTIAFNSFANPSGTNPRGYFLAFTMPANVRRACSGSIARL